MHADVFHEYRIVKMLRLMDDLNDESDNSSRRLIPGINYLSAKQKIVKTVNFLLKIEKLSISFIFKIRRLLYPQRGLQLSFNWA